MTDGRKKAILKIWFNAYLWQAVRTEKERDAINWKAPHSGRICPYSNLKPRSGFI